MRVIAGKYKSIQLISPRGEVRPTTDLVKGSLFSVLDSKGLLRDACCLDLFCGSGALGIEALSRGASDCVFADMDTSNVMKNLRKIKLECRVISGDFRYALRKLRDEKFDLVFCDPPYKSGFSEQAYKLLVKYRIIDKNGVAVLEHSSANDLINISEDSIIDKRVFGASAFDLVRGEDESDIPGDV